jgi:hypothetical protein
VALAVLVLRISAPFREAQVMQATKAWAAELAQACLMRNGCELPLQSLTVSLGRDAAYVGISGRGVIPAGERKLQPTQVIIPYQDSEALMIMLGDVGPLSKAASRLMVSREDLHVIQVVTAE